MADDDLDALLGDILDFSAVPTAATAHVSAPATTRLASAPAAAATAPATSAVNDPEPGGGRRPQRKNAGQIDRFTDDKPVSTAPPASKLTAGQKRKHNVATGANQIGDSHLKLAAHKAAEDVLEFKEKIRSGAFSSDMLFMLATVHGISEERCEELIALVAVEEAKAKRAKERRKQNSKPIFPQLEHFVPFFTRPAPAFAVNGGNGPPVSVFKPRDLDFQWGGMSSEVGPVRKPPAPLSQHSHSGGPTAVPSSSSSSAAAASPAEQNARYDVAVLKAARLAVEYGRTAYDDAGLRDAIQHTMISSGAAVAVGGGAGTQHAGHKRLQRTAHIAVCPAVINIAPLVMQHVSAASPNPVGFTEVGIGICRHCGMHDGSPGSSASGAEAASVGQPSPGAVASPASSPASQLSFEAKCLALLASMPYVGCGIGYGLHSLDKFGIGGSDLAFAAASEGVVQSQQLQRTQPSQSAGAAIAAASLHAVPAAESLDGDDDNDSVVIIDGSDSEVEIISSTVIAPMLAEVNRPRSTRPAQSAGGASAASKSKSGLQLSSRHQGRGSNSATSALAAPAPSSFASQQFESCPHPYAVWRSLRSRMYNPDRHMWEGTGCPSMRHQRAGSADHDENVGSTGICRSNSGGGGSSGPSASSSSTIAPWPLLADRISSALASGSDVRGDAHQTSPSVANPSSSAAAPRTTPSYISVSSFLAVLLDLGCDLRGEGWAGQHLMGDAHHAFSAAIDAAEAMLHSFVSSRSTNVAHKPVGPGALPPPLSRSQSLCAAISTTADALAISIAAHALTFEAGASAGSSGSGSSKSPFGGRIGAAKKANVFASKWPEYLYSSSLLTGVAALACRLAVDPAIAGLSSPSLGNPASTDAASGAAASSASPSTAAESAAASVYNLLATICDVLAIRTAISLTKKHLCYTAEQALHRGIKAAQQMRQQQSSSQGHHAASGAGDVGGNDSDAAGGGEDSDSATDDESWYTPKLHHAALLYVGVDPPCAFEPQSQSEPKDTYDSEWTVGIADIVLRWTLARAFDVPLRDHEVLLLQMEHDASVVTAGQSSTAAAAAAPVGPAGKRARLGDHAGSSSSSDVHHSGDIVQAPSTTGQTRAHNHHHHHHLDHMLHIPIPVVHDHVWVGAIPCPQHIAASMEAFGEWLWKQGPAVIGARIQVHEDADEMGELDGEIRGQAARQPDLYAATTGGVRRGDTQRNFGMWRTGIITGYFQPGHWLREDEDEEQNGDDGDGGDDSGDDDGSNEGVGAGRGKKGAAVDKPKRKYKRRGLRFTEPKQQSKAAAVASDDEEDDERNLSGGLSKGYVSEVPFHEIAWLDTLHNPPTLEGHHVQLVLMAHPCRPWPAPEPEPPGSSSSSSSSSAGSSEPTFIRTPMLTALVPAIDTEHQKAWVGSQWVDIDVPEDDEAEAEDADDAAGVGDEEADGQLASAIDAAIKAWSHHTPGGKLPFDPRPVDHVSAHTRRHVDIHRSPMRALSIGSSSRHRRVIDDDDDDGDSSAMDVDDGVGAADGKPSSHGLKYGEAMAPALTRAIVAAMRGQYGLVGSSTMINGHVASYSQPFNAAASHYPHGALPSGGHNGSGSSGGSAVVFSSSSSQGASSAGSLASSAQPSMSLPALARNLSTTPARKVWNQYGLVVRSAGSLMPGHLELPASAIASAGNKPAFGTGGAAASSSSSSAIQTAPHGSMPASSSSLHPPAIVMPRRPELDHAHARIGALDSLCSMLLGVVSHSHGVRAFAADGDIGTRALPSYLARAYVTKVPFVRPSASPSAASAACEDALAWYHPTSPMRSPLALLLRRLSYAGARAIMRCGDNAESRTNADDKARAERKRMAELRNQLVDRLNAVKVEEKQKRRQQRLAAAAAVAGPSPSSAAAQAVAAAAEADASGSTADSEDGHNQTSTSSAAAAGPDLGGPKSVAFASPSRSIHAGGGGIGMHGHGSNSIQGARSPLRRTAGPVVAGPYLPHPHQQVAGPSAASSQLAMHAASSASASDAHRMEHQHSSSSQGVGRGVKFADDSEPTATAARSSGGTSVLSQASGGSAAGHGALSTSSAVQSHSRVAPPPHKFSTAQLALLHPSTYYEMNLRTQMSRVATTPLDLPAGSGRRFGADACVKFSHYQRLIVITDLYSIALQMLWTHAAPKPPPAQVVIGGPGGSKMKRPLFNDDEESYDGGDGAGSAVIASGAVGNLGAPPAPLAYPSFEVASAAASGAAGNSSSSSSAGGASQLHSMCLTFTDPRISKTGARYGWVAFGSPAAATPAGYGASTSRQPASAAAYTFPQAAMSTSAVAASQSAIVLSQLSPVPLVIRPPDAWCRLMRQYDDASFEQYARWHDKTVADNLKIGDKARAKAQSTSSRRYEGSTSHFALFQWEGSAGNGSGIVAAWKHRVVSLMEWLDAFDEVKMA